MMVDKFNKEVSQILKNANELELKGKFREAATEYERIARLNPGDGNIFNHLGDLYVKIGKTGEAIESYLKGIDIFRNDNFLRNALGICKKVLRYDPGNLEINLIIAKLLIELDEKSDASIYLVTYIERQMAAGNKKEVLQAMEHLKELKLSDNKFNDKMAQIYQKVGEPKMASTMTKQTESLKTHTKPLEDSLEIETTTPLIIEQKVKDSPPVDRKSTIDMRSFDDTIIKNSVDRLEESIKDIDRVMNEMRKAIRLDEVIIALDKSLSLFSQEQTKTIGLLHKSLHTNLDSLQKAVVNYQQHTEKNSKEFETLIHEIGRSISSVSENQKYVGQEITRHLEKISTSFNQTAHGALTEVKTMIAAYQKSTDDMVCSLGETKECNVSLLKVSDDIKTGIQTLTSTLTKFISAQESKERNFNRNIYIVIGILGLTGILVLISLFVR